MTEDDTVDAFTAKLNGYATKAKELGKTLDESLLVRKLLDSTPDRFIQIVAFIDQTNDLDDITLDGIIGKLKAFEERIKLRKGGQVEQTFHEETGNVIEIDTTQRRKAQLTKENQSGISEQSNLILEDDKPSLLITAHETEHEEVLLNEGHIQLGKYATTDASIWYLDNGASNHMTGTKSHFRDINESTTGRVRFGDGSYMEIKGRGSILLGCRNHEQKIVSDVYYIPNLKSNILIEKGSKSCRLYDPKGKRKHVSRDVRFTETKPWDWDNNGKETRNYSTITRSRLSNQHTQHPYYNPHSEKEEEATSSSTKRSENGFDDTTVRGFKDLTEIYNNAREVETENLLFTVEEEEPRNYKEASTDKKWIEAMEIELDSINKNNTWTLTTLPTNHKAIGLKWVFKTKRDAKGEIIKYKARLVAKGYVQEQGIDFDEVFAPVARIETVRLILALAAYHGWQVHHLDVKSAFLHGDLKEEVYVTQPEGFIQQGNSGKVYKLTKALYGLRQAPRAWNVKLDQTLKSLDFKKCNLEQAVYTKRSKTSTLIVGVYVDDLIITGTPRKEIDLFKSQMKDKFEMSDLGLLAYYLGIEVTQTGGEITIKQTGYINKILKESSMMESNDTKIPMDPGTKLVKAEDGNSVDATYYRSLIGSLRYLLHTRPDLSYSVRLLIKFRQDPKDHHLKAIKQVIRYIKGTKEHGIIYKKEGGCKITGYSDSSYGVNTDQGKGTTGIVFYFGESPITWCTQKQPTVALSSCESEFMAATRAACQALWLKRLLSEITGWDEERITLKVDNISAIALVRNPVFHGISKHIDIRYHFIRECVKNRHINVEHVSGELQRVDILTKALPRLKFVTMRQMLGVQDLGRSNDQD
ncbi:ribonuclease H-like domain, reverse transcriptase, RNA-dependent DNA polymerase [Tanacetum coccineum]